MPAGDVRRIGLGPDDDEVVPGDSGSRWAVLGAIGAFTVEMLMASVGIRSAVAEGRRSAAADSRSSSGCCRRASA